MVIFKVFALATCFRRLPFGCSLVCVFAIFKTRFFHPKKRIYQLKLDWTRGRTLALFSDLRCDHKKNLVRADTAGILFAPCRYNWCFLKLFFMIFSISGQFEAPFRAPKIGAFKWCFGVQKGSVRGEGYVLSGKA